MPNHSVLIIGAGIAGMKVAVNLANMGFNVHLLDLKTYLGGKLVEMDRWFPDRHCGMCRILPHGENIPEHCVRRGLNHPRIRLWLNSKVDRVFRQEDGNFEVSIRCAFAGIAPELCIGCGLCEKVCPVETKSEFQRGLGKRKAIYAPYPLGLPRIYLVDEESCVRCGLCKGVCPTHAITLEFKDHTFNVAVQAIIVSIGLELFDPTKNPWYGYGRFDNVITSMQVERMLSGSGPTEGVLVRPSDGKNPNSVAFIQCVGSRDKVHNYCSSVCCMQAIKHALIIKERQPFIDVCILAKDLRVLGKDDCKIIKQAEEQGVKVVRSVGYPKEVAGTKNLEIVIVDDKGNVQKKEFELVVLSVGLIPSASFNNLSTLGVTLDEQGFVKTEVFRPVSCSVEGIYVCGTVSGPKDIRETILEADAVALEIYSRLKKNSKMHQEIAVPAWSQDQEKERIGIIICSCEDQLKKSVDIDMLVDVCSKWPCVGNVQSVSHLCLPELMGKKVGEAAYEGNNRLIIAACRRMRFSATLREALEKNGFDYSSTAFVDILEDVALPHENNKPEATQKALTMLSMAHREVGLAAPFIRELGALPVPVALVVGGGLAGLSVASWISRAGFQVHLVEKSLVLGGHLRHVYFTLGNSDSQKLLSELIAQVENNPLVQISKGAQVIKVEGHIGDFEVLIDTNGKGLERSRVGAIIFATGGLEFVPSDYPYGKNVNVVTQTDLEEMIFLGEIDPQNLRLLVMIQCVGSRDDTHPYCSRICCPQAIKNALLLKERWPDVSIVILYRDINMPGILEQFYAQALQKGVRFIRYEETSKPVIEIKKGRVEIAVRDTILQRWLKLEPDLVVLSCGIVPSEDNRILARLTGIGITDEGFFKEWDSKFEPVELVPDGIFACGLAISPGDIRKTILEAEAVAHRAIAFLSRRIELSRHVSETVQTMCRKCQICVDVCPYMARFFEAEEGCIKVNELICRGCETCVAMCPSGAARVKGKKEKGKIAMALIDALR